MKYFYTFATILNLVAATLWATNIKAGWWWVLLCGFYTIYFGRKAIQSWKVKESADGTN